MKRPIPRSPMMIHYSVLNQQKSRTRDHVLPGALVINPRRTVLALCVCVCVCRSVTALAATAFVSACNQRHGIYGIILGLKLVDFRKTLPFNSYGEKKLICKLVIAHCEPFLRTFWTNETHELLEAQPVSQILLQTLATGATGLK